MPLVRVDLAAGKPAEYRTKENWSFGNGEAPYARPTRRVTGS